MTTAVIVQKQAPVAEYSEFESQLAQFERDYMSRVYKFETAADLKAAKSDRYTVKKVKAAIEKARKSIKQPHLDAAKLIDEEAAAYTTRAENVEQYITQQIEKHESIEKERQAKLDQMIGAIKEFAEIPHDGTSSDIRQRLQSAEAVEITAEFEERRGEAALVKDQVITKLKTALPEIEKQEANAAELARLRKEAEERAKQEEQDRIRREAEARAQAEAKAAVERAEREKQEAIERAKREEQERIDAELAAYEENAERERIAALAAPDAEKLAEIGAQLDALIERMPPVETDQAKAAFERVKKALHLAAEDCLSTARALKS